MLVKAFDGMTTSQTESLRMKEDFGAPFDGSVFSFLS